MAFTIVMGMESNYSIVMLRDVLMEGVGGVAPTQYFQICKRVVQKLARLPRGLATVFSVTFFF